MNAAWLKLAWIEFQLPFRYWKGGGCPGGRDFLWLSIFLSLLLTLVLMLFASSEGVLNRFVDVLLGKKPQHGVPIWITPNSFKRSGINNINTEILLEIKKHGYEVAPYREIEIGFDTYVEFPGENIWGLQVNMEGKILNSEVVDFNGWAVYANDPLWPKLEEERNFPLKLVVNKSLFARNFNYQAYRKGVADYLPKRLMGRLPESITGFDSLNTLWLKLKVGGRSEIVAFDIVWVDYIHAVEKVVFLFPLTTYHALQFAHRYPEIKYFPEGYGEGGERVKQLSLEGDSGAPNIKDFAAAIDAKLTPFRGDALAELKGEISKALVEANAQEFAVKYQVEYSVSGDPIKHSTYNIELPCRKLPDTVETVDNFQSCNGDVSHPVSMDVTNNGNGFLRALVYIPDREQLFDAVNKLLEVSDGAISIHPVYKDALNKFAFLTRMIESMRHPFGFVLLVSLVALVGIQLFILVGHRRHRYGMFLSKGFQWWHIYSMVLFQITLALVIGVAVSVSSVHVMRYYLQQVIKVIAVEYKETLSLVDLNLMPLSVAEYIGVTVTVLLLTCILAAKVLYFLPLRRRTHPAVLFQQ